MSEFQIETGHHASCVCGHCSNMRQECKWPRKRDSRGHFVVAPDRYGHNWVADNGVFLRCDNCGQRAVFGVRKHAPGPGEVEQSISTVRLV